MTLQRNHYEVLGVPPTATTDQIKKKYRELARKFHPDVVKDKALGQKIFTQVNQAYRVLADPERRAQYDVSLRADTPAGRNGAASPTGTSAPARTNGAGPAGNGTAASNGTAAAAAAPLTPQQVQAVTRLLGDADFALMNADAQTARAHCDSALKIDPRNARALGLLGDALVILDQREAAAAAYRRSLQIAPSARVQGSLARLESGAIPTRTNPPGASPRPSTTPPGGPPAGGTRTTHPNSGPENKPSGGLFGRFLGKKK